MSKRHLDKWVDHVRSNFVRIYETTLSRTNTHLSKDEFAIIEESENQEEALQGVKLVKKEADR